MERLPRKMLQLPWKDIDYSKPKFLIGNVKISVCRWNINVQLFKMKLIDASFFFKSFIYKPKQDLLI